MSNRFTKFALISTSLILPLTLLSGTLVGWYFKGGNPDQVDITAGLAYLRPILATSFMVFIGLTLLSLFLTFVGLKKQEDKSLVKTSFYLIVIILLVSSLTAVAQNKVSHIEDDYRASQSSLD